MKPSKPLSVYLRNVILVVSAVSASLGLFGFFKPKAISGLSEYGDIGLYGTLIICAIVAALITWLTRFSSSNDSDEELDNVSDAYSETNTANASTSRTDFSRIFRIKEWSLSGAKAIGTSLIYYLFDSVSAQLIIAATPVFVGIIITFVLRYTGTKPPYPEEIRAINTILFLSASWTLSGLGAVLWFADHRMHLEKRSNNLLGAMTLNDDHVMSLIIEWIESSACDEQTRGHLRLLVDHAINEALGSLTRIMASRYNEDRKNASLLILDPTNPIGDFRLYRKLHPQQPDVRSLIGTLTRADSLAGEAIDSDKTVKIDDCRTNDHQHRWQKIGEDPYEPRYVARVAAPVTDRITETCIGSLCFDINVVWTPTSDELEIMATTATRIATLWLVLELIDHEIERSSLQNNVTHSR